MKRTNGKADAKLMVGFGRGIQAWLVRWDMQPIVENGEIVGQSYYEEQMVGKPSVEKIKEIVLNGMNALIDEQILGGFEWNGMKVWLSSENQFNYKAAYDLAVQTDGENLPVVFKFGIDKEPVYYTLSTVDELKSFYVSAMSHINTCLSEGWKKKDGVDWSAYEAIFNAQADKKPMSLKELKAALNSGEFNSFVADNGVSLLSKLKKK